MRLDIYTLLLVLFFLNFSCLDLEEQTSDQAVSQIKKVEHFLISNTGDTIHTGVPIPARGRKIDHEGVTRPEKIPLRGTPKMMHAHTNIHPVGSPKVLRIPAELRTITPGQDSIPLPQMVPAKGKRVPSAQPPTIPASAPRMKDAAIYNIQYLDVDQGMVSSYIWSLLEDNQGNLWFGTNNGISRYDGNSFTHYSTDEGLGHNRVRSILQDDHGNIWFGTDGGGVSCYDGNSFTQYTTEEGLNVNHVWSMLEDREGNIWFGTSAGVSRFDGSHFTHYTSEEGLSSDNVWCMLEDTHGNLWFGTQGGGVSRYDGSFIHFTTKEGLSNNNIWSMLEDSNGDLWFGTNGGGVNRYDGITFTHYTTEEGLNNNQVWSMLEDREGNIWFGTRGSGVNRYDGTDFTHYTMEEGLSNNRVWSILEDKQGKLWFGTRGGGVNRFDFRSFSHYTTAQGLSNNEVGAILEDTNGGLWFGTELGVNYFDGSSFTHYTSKEGLIGNTVNTILEGSHGDVWFGTSLGLSRFDGTSFFPYTTNEGLGHNNVQSSSKDSQGNLWFGTVGGGVSRYDGNHFTHYSTKEGLSHNTIRSILEDRRGNIWFGTQGGGASRFDGTSFVHYTTAEGLGNNLVWCIFEDSQGHLWFGTQGGGVSRYDGNSFTNYTTKEGLSHNWVWSLLEDENKNIWISTEDGITVLSPSVDSISVANSTTIGDYQAFTFGKADGLRRLDFSQSACIDRNNHIWWGSTDGLTMLNLNHFALPSDPPQIRLNIIEVSQTYVDYRRLTDSDYRLSFEFGPALFESYDSVVAFRNYPTTMTLPYNIKHLTFGFSAIDWAAPHKLQYSYLMEGLDKNWSPLSFENKVDYRNLVPGTYRLKLKAFGAAQVWSDPFDYSFSIYPPWWLSWWAKLLYIISGLWLIISFVRWRTASFKQRHIELEKTVAERTAEVLAQTAEAVAQRNRSEELLLNILPAEVAEELKETGRTQPMHFEEVSILFADFKEFTNIVASIPGKKLVEELDDMFQYFDDIIDSEGLEKIQTVGDAYVAAGGLPKKIPDHALRCVQAAKKMMDYLERRNEHSAIKWRLRVGIHSGPITAGVVGKKKFSYDIFGDTVNIAARIESSSEAGRINVSAYTYDLIRNNYTCEYRGKINAKGKGDLDMYFVN